MMTLFVLGLAPPVHEDQWREGALFNLDNPRFNISVSSLIHDTCKRPWCFLDMIWHSD